MAAAAYLPHIGLLFDGISALVAAQGTYTVSGQAASLIYSGARTDTPAPLPHLGLLGGIGGAAGVSEAGSYSVTGQDAAFLLGRRVTADAGFYVLSGQPANISVSVNQGGNPAPLPHLGLLLASTTTAYTLTADTGIYSVVGSDGLADFEMSSAQGSYGIAGQDAALLKTHILVADVGAYAVSGQTVSFAISSPARVMPADTQTYAVSGQDAALLVNRTLAAEQGFYGVLGQAAALSYGVARALTMIAETGSYSVFGADQALTFGGKVLLADFGAYQVTGGDVFGGSTVGVGGYDDDDKKPKKKRWLVKVGAQTVEIGSLKQARKLLDKLDQQVEEVDPEEAKESPLPKVEVIDRPEPQEIKADPQIDRLLEERIAQYNAAAQAVAKLLEEMDDEEALLMLL